MGLGDLTEQLRQQPASGGPDDPETRIAGDLVAARRHLRGEIFQLVKYPPSPVHDDHSLVGQASTLPIDQGDAELAFEAGDVAADVGLHGVEGTSGRGERAMIGDRHECGQLAKIHLKK